MTSSDVKSVKINLQPGINKNTTEYDAEGGYVDADKVRFRYGRPEKIGGWVGEITTPSTGFVGTARDINTWIDLDENKYVGVGTNERLQIFNGGVIFDVTPITTAISTTNRMSTTSGSPYLTVSVNAHPGRASDWVLFQTTASVAGVRLSSEYQIVSAGLNYFIVDMGANANATVTSAGGAGTFQFLYYSGAADNGAAYGWGVGTWGTPGLSASGSAGWGKPRGSIRGTTELRQWTLDNWGEDLLANPRGGPIFTWVASAGLTQRARVISTAAPSIVNIALVAQPNRHVVAFGTHNASGVFDPLLVRWSDSENYAVWNAAVTNQAGSFRLDSGSFIQAAVKTRREIVIFTDEALHTMRRIGGDFIFSFDKLGKIPGIASQHAAVDVNGIVYWMSPSGFYFYDGTIQSLPCTLTEYLFKPTSPGCLNLAQTGKVFAGINSTFNEIIWFYPAGTDTECSRYVIYNYLENTWYDGTIDRTVWNDIDIFDRPYAVRSDGKLFVHEEGKNDDASGMKAYLVTSDFEVGSGENLMYIDTVIPDSTLSGSLNLTFSAWKYPNDTDVITKGPYQINNTTTKFHPRVRARNASLRYSCSAQNADFRLGSNRLFIKPDGQR